MHLEGVFELLELGAQGSVFPFLLQACPLFFQGAAQALYEVAVYDEMPSLTVRMSGGGFLTTVPVTEHWVSYETDSVATHRSAFYVYLNGPGAALVDDLSLTDTATGAEHVPNGDHNA